jgi:hypothetical protein
MRCVAIGWLSDEAFVFVKRLQAGNLYTRMRWQHSDAMQCVALGWLSDEAFVFVKCLQAVYIYTRMRWQHSDAMRCSRLVEWWCFFICKSLQAVTKTHACRPRNPRLKDAHTGTKRRVDDTMINRDSVISGTARMRWQHSDANRARNPRFYFVHASTKPRFRTKMRHQKSGIPCSGCDALLSVGWVMRLLYL